MKREKVKTIILVVLVTMCIFLTQKIWFISPFTMLQSEASNLGVNQEQVLEIRNDVLRPIKFNINLGGYHVNPGYTDDIWHLSKDFLESYFLGEPEVLPTTIDKYNELKNLKSIEIHFGKNIPSVLISSVFGAIDNRVVRNVKEIEQILIPAAANGDIYILNGTSVFKASHNNYNSRTLNQLFQYIEGRSYNRFYPLFLDIGNPVLMPLSFTNSLPKMYVDSEINIADDSIVVEHAKTFFDRNFDFIKTIKETSGSTVFIYGYGEKSVRINNRGRIEYSEDVGTPSSTNVINALDSAINFVLNHGTFPEDTYLKEIRPIEKNRGYYFGFSYKVNDRPIHFVDSNSTNTIEVEVYGDKIKNYKSFIRNPVDLPNVEVTNQMLLPHKIIDDNYEMLKEDYLNSFTNQDVAIDEMILNEIMSVELVYLDTLDQVTNQLIIPCWRVIVKDSVYYFDAYDGTLRYKTVVN